MSLRGLPESPRALPINFRIECRPFASATPRGKTRGFCARFAPPPDAGLAGQHPNPTLETPQQAAGKVPAFRPLRHGAAVRDVRNRFELRRSKIFLDEPPQNWPHLPRQSLIR